MKKTLVLLIALPHFLFGQQKGVQPIAQTAGPASGQTRAVVIGISDYQEADIPDLRFADRDAAAFANFLRSPAGGGLDNDHLQVLTNQNATAGRVAEALDALVEQTKEGEQVIIYFSGHGDVERKIISQPGFLLCWDAPSRVYMGGGTYSLAFLEAVVTTLSVENKAKVVVVTDACHAGKLAGSQIGGAKLTAANLARQFSNEVKILSCQPGELSLEGEQWGGGRGIFSYHLVDGLFGLADKNADGFVTLGEIDRYLEDKVTAEAAPQSQVPMLLGNKTERLATVNAAVLADLQKSKASGLPVFAATESRGFEDAFLEKADSSLRGQYLAFKKAISEKRFFSPENDCAEFYYAQLLARKDLADENESHAPLRGVMKRNYAAALQDDAQQVLNTMLKTGLTELVLSGAIEERLYEKYPLYIGRAAELLGKEHYLYSTLMARQEFFKGKTAKTKPERKMHFLKALQWEPAMPHAMLELGVNEGAQNLDSAKLYLAKASELLPGWVLPYVKLSEMYEGAGQFELAFASLDTAGRVDSSSVLVWYKTAMLFRQRRLLDKAEPLFVKVLKTTASDEVCFPCAHMLLGVLYMNTGRANDAKAQFQKAIEANKGSGIDNRGFCNPCAYINMGIALRFTDSLEASLAYFKKAIEVDSTYAKAHANTGATYLQMGNNVEAEKHLKKAMQLDAKDYVTNENMGVVCFRLKRYNEAEQWLLKSIELNARALEPRIYLALVYFETARYGLSEKTYLEALKIDPKSILCLHGLGCALLKQGRFAEAEAMFRSTLELDSKFGYAYHGLACAYSHQKDQKAGFDNLKQALENGYTDFESLQTDPDLEYLRNNSKQWKPLMKKHFPDKVKD